MPDVMHMDCLCCLVKNDPKKNPVEIVLVILHMLKTESSVEQIESDLCFEHRRMLHNAMIARNKENTE